MQKDAFEINMEIVDDLKALVNSLHSIAKINRKVLFTYILHNFISRTVFKESICIERIEKVYSSVLKWEKRKFTNDIQIPHFRCFGHRRAHGTAASK